MGCGDGILSIVGAHLWDAQVLAVEIAEAGVAATRAAAGQHGVSERVEALRSDGFAHRLIGERGPYDLIIVNLLAEKIIEWGQHVKKNSSPGGVVFTGGILHWQSAEVVAAYEALGFELIQELRDPTWWGGIFCHKSDI